MQKRCEQLSRVKHSLPEGKELTPHHDAQYLSGERRLYPSEITFEDEIMECDSKLNFYIPVTFDPDAVFGLHVATAENDDYVNVYANYDMESNKVCDELTVLLSRGDGSETEYKYKLTASDCEVLRSTMDTYCQEQTGMGLNEYAAQCMAEEQHQPTMGL